MGWISLGGAGTTRDIKGGAEGDHGIRGCASQVVLLLLYALFNHPRLLIQVARVQKSQFSYRLDGLVP